MDDANTLLATLSQSAAAIVAIIGGFLVSRLVALSSEREGLRRQLQSARAHMDRVRREYEEAHLYRLGNSAEQFIGAVAEQVLSGEYGEDDLLEENYPRGSSVEEMRPVLHGLARRTGDIYQEVRSLLQRGDTSRLALQDLEDRGLKVPDVERDLYDLVVDHLAEQELPDPASATLWQPIIRPSALIAADRETSARRLDESIRDEQTSRADRDRLQGEINHIENELIKLGRPVGVTSAIAILAMYSFLGIALPLVVMTLQPEELSAWLRWGLLGASLVGLASVLAYILWYARTLNDPIADEVTS